MLRVGTDCSGLDAVATALNQIGRPFSYEFASDICPIVRTLLEKGDQPPRQIFGDIRKRPVANVPEVDLYVAGFPCQPFSTRGLRKGLNDERNVFHRVLEYIQTHLPRAFLLENVQGLVQHDHGRTFAAILQQLDMLPGYTVEWRLLSPHQFGWPQRRVRVFMIGRRDVAGGFVWPAPTTAPRQTLESVLLSREEAVRHYAACTRPLRPYYQRALAVVQRLAADQKRDLDAQPNIILLGQAPGNEYLGVPGICPCLTSKTHYYYVTHQKRFLAPQETLLLQGYPIDHPAASLPLEKLRLLTGNSIHVGLVGLLLAELVAERVRGRVE